MANLNMEDCPICLDKLNGRCKVHTTECNHTFHTKCFAKIKGGLCPCCRAVFPKDKKTTIADMKKIIKETEEQYKLFKQENKKIVAERFKDENIAHNELKKATTRLQILVTNVSGYSFDSIIIQTEKIKALTRLFDEQKRFVRLAKKRSIDCNEYFSGIIEQQKYTLNDFKRDNSI